jgi:hypothetical protein
VPGLVTGGGRGVWNLKSCSTLSISSNVVDLDVVHHWRVHVGHKNPASAMFAS